jgi:hypothetical protein
MSFKVAQNHNKPTLGYDFVDALLNLMGGSNGNNGGNNVAW